MVQYAIPRSRLSVVEPDLPTHLLLLELYNTQRLGESQLCVGLVLDQCDRMDRPGYHNAHCDLYPIEVLLGDLGLLLVGL